MATRNNNIVDNVLDAQKKAADKLVENTKKITGDNKVLNDTIEKGNDWYKNWLDTQKSFFNKFSGAADNAKAETAKESTNTANDFLQNWMEAQANYAKQMWEMGQESAKKFGFDMTQNPFAAFTNNNPFAGWQNMATANNPWAAWMNQAAMNNWMNQAQSMNPFTAEGFRKASENMTDMFSKYYNTLNSNITEWQKSFENGTVQDAYKNMINSADGFTKFAEMWLPMVKSMQEKTFSMDEYKKLMNPELYKEFMDKFFGFMPESSREYMNKMSGMMKDSVGKMTDAGMNGYTQARDMMNMFTQNGSKGLGSINNMYTNWYNQVSEAAAPFTKLMTPSQQTKTAQEWNDINNRIVEFNMKNAELQYMIYTQGAKVMDKLAESVAKKVKDGVEVKSVLDLYQEWLNISDKVYVSLFESNDYSALMSQVGAMQMKLRKDIELATEKMFADVPVATRSQMDDVYKTIYELKKKVRQLEKMLDMEGDEEVAAAPAKPAAKKAAAKRRK